MRNLFFVLALCAGFFSQVAQASTASEELTKLLKPIETFSASFEQTLVSASGQTLQQVTGVLKAQRPGLFFWHTQPPLEQTIVTDGEMVWLYDPDLEQVTVQTLSQQLSNTPALLLSGEVSTIDREYNVVSRETGNAETSIFQLTPKGVDSLFDTLQLGFNHGVLTTMELKDSLGQVTTLYFSDSEMNLPFSENTFHFEIPDGVDVIRE
ncbi:outer membrane lipoprotein carrier protein LolA [Hahella sp. CCB-MM4]|uniref:outer membrane lipoprotein chaperone LolA n=1 Tax=Hahella sp. (strain CCB-MM4) TaxID=1926491 RepID=UPI000B9B2E9D|nr:outer membrane lipoprotein chaperone LolA [Hahella sp. CCB-MM4]OZG73653.1 outer membrane lipoprotein carrier protein LolA [Hahella sp. CCB-MM4]